jgi:trigger factor
MQATISDAGTLRKQVTVTYSQAEVDSRREEVLHKLSGQVKLDGFRPGKSSKAIVAKRYGSAAISQAQEELADEGFKRAIEQHQLKPLGPIKNESMKATNGLELVVSFDIKPAIALPQPTAITVTKQDIMVSDADVQTALDQLCKRAGSMSALTDGETIIEDDSITLTGTVKVDDKEVRKLHDFHHLVGGYSLLGTKPEDVIALCKGKGVGAQLSFTTTLPKTFTPAEAADKQAHIDVTVQSAQRQRPAEANDEFAKRMGIDDVATLKARLKDQQTQQKEGELHQKQITELTDALINSVQITLPENLRADSLKANLEPRLKKAKEEKKSDEEIATLTKETTAEVEKSLKRYLVIDAIAEQYNVKVMREDLESQIQMAAMRSGRKPQDIADQLQKSGQVNQVVAEIREAKALEVMLDKVLGREAAPVLSAAAHGEVGHVHGPDCNH